MENTETKHATEAVSQHAYSHKALHDALTKLCKLQAFLDAIAYITDSDCSKNGYTLNVLAREGAALCTATQEILDIMELQELQRK